MPEPPLAEGVNVLAGLLAPSPPLPVFAVAFVGDVTPVFPPAALVTEDPLIEDAVPAPPPVPEEALDVPAPPEPPPPPPKPLPVVELLPPLLP